MREDQDIADDDMMTTRVGFQITVHGVQDRPCRCARDLEMGARYRVLENSRSVPDEYKRYVENERRAQRMGKREKYLISSTKTQKQQGKQLGEGQASGRCKVYGGRLEDKAEHGRMEDTWIAIQLRGNL